MVVHISELFKLNTLSSGRRMFALRKLRPIAQHYGYTRLVTRIDQALQHEEHVRVLNWEWEASKRQEASDPIKELDSLLDQTVTAVRDGAASQARGARPDAEITGKVEHFLATLFPAGVQAITHLSYVEELDGVEFLLSKLGGELAPLVVDFGLGRQVERLAELSAEYRAALESKPTRMRFDVVREARATGQNHLLAIVAIIVARYCDDHDPEHMSARAQLLAPILEQHEAVRAYLSARRAVRDIDPDTGALLDEPTPEQPVEVEPEPAPAAV
jgi:hypothetical protein